MTSPRVTDTELAEIDARTEDRRRIHGLLLANGWSPRAIRGAERRIRRQTARIARTGTKEA